MAPSGSRGSHEEDPIHGRADTVLPDVIVHKRGVDNSNLLIIEMKKSANQPGLKRDIRRIEAFRAELRYVFGALVVCKTGDDPSIDIEWYE